MPDPKPPANEDKVQTQGRKDNAAQHLNAADDNAGVERYPPVNKDDSVTQPGKSKDPMGERRSFEGNVESPEPRQGREPDPSVNQGRLGPGGDPAEGKR